MAEQPQGLKHAVQYFMKASAEIIDLSLLSIIWLCSFGVNSFPAYKFNLMTSLASTPATNCSSTKILTRCLFFFCGEIEVIITDFDAWRLKLLEVF